MECNSDGTTVSVLTFLGIEGGYCHHWGGGGGYNKEWFQLLSWVRLLSDFGEEENITLSPDDLAQLLYVQVGEEEQ